VAHLSHLVSHVLLSWWWKVWHYHQYGPKDGGTQCEGSSLLFCAHSYSFVVFALSGWWLWAAEWEVLFGFVMHVMSMSSQCLALMSWDWISVYSPHLSTMGPMYFIMPPLLRLPFQAFKRMSAECSVIPESSQCGCPKKTREWVFSKKLDRCTLIEALSGRDDLGI